MRGMRRGRTPLSYCATASDDFIAWLISQGADLQAKDDAGRLPLDYMKPDRALKFEAEKMYSDLAQNDAVIVRNIGAQAKGESLFAIRQESKSDHPPTVAAILRRALGDGSGVWPAFDVIVCRRAEDGMIQEASRLSVHLGTGEDAAEKQTSLPEFQWGDVVVIEGTPLASGGYVPGGYLDQWLTEHGYPENPQPRIENGTPRRVGAGRILPETPKEAPPAPDPVEKAKPQN